MGSSNATGSGGGGIIVFGFLALAAIFILAFWVVGAILAVLVVVHWAWGVWHEKSPAEIGSRSRAWLAPRFHYPFVGPGSVLASVAGALAVNAIVTGSNPIVGALVLALVLARALSMAAFPWPRTDQSGLRVYPLVAITGPISSGLGILAVWLLVLGGQMLSQPQPDPSLAMSMVPAAIIVILLATAVGRVGRIVVPSSAQRRIDIDSLLDHDEVDAGRVRALAEDPMPRHMRIPSARRQMATGRQALQTERAGR